MFIQHLPEREHQEWKSPWSTSLFLGTDVCQPYHQQQGQQFPGTWGEGEAAHTVARAGRNCLDDSKGGIAQLTGKQNRVLHLSPHQGVSQRLCVPRTNTLYLIQCNQHEVPTMRVWGCFCLVVFGRFFGWFFFVVGFGFLVVWLFGFGFGFFFCIIQKVFRAWRFSGFLAYRFRGFCYHKPDTNSITHI